MTGSGADMADNGFHRLVTLAEVRRQTAAMPIIADADERAAIAARFDLIALDRLEATLDCVVTGDVLRVSGVLHGDVVQRCVATGEPLSARVETPVDVSYVPLGKLEAAENEAEIELGENDLDIIGYPVGGRIDLGEMVADSLYLALQPFPRHPDADAFLKARGVQSEAEAGAFGALAALRDKLSGSD